MEEMKLCSSLEKFYETAGLEEKETRIQKPKIFMINSSSILQHVKLSNSQGNNVIPLKVG